MSRKSWLLVLTLSEVRVIFVNKNGVNTTVSVGVSDFDGTATTLSQKIRGEIDKKDKSRHYKIEFFSFGIVDFIEGFHGGDDLTVELWWAMPMELHRGSCDELRGELLAMGVEFDPISARKQLSNYLNQDPPNRKILCATQVGWCGESFVLPDVVIGPTAENIIFQSGERVHDEHTRAGTLDEWKAEIASLAIGNPLLILALSGSFVGPLLARCIDAGID